MFPESKVSLFLNKSVVEVFAVFTCWKDFFLSSSDLHDVVLILTIDHSCIW